MSETEAASLRAYSVTNGWTRRVCTNKGNWHVPGEKPQGLNEGLGFHRTAESSGLRPTPGKPRHEDYRENEPENPEERSLKHQCEIQAKTPEAFPRLEIGK